MLSEMAEAYITHRGVNEGRVILHADLNNFFASVELLGNKALRGKPVAVCGSKEERHGIVLAKNYIAKAAGVQTAEAIWQAKSKCPELVILPPHYDAYLAYSAAVRRIFGKFSDRVEPFGMDEAWIDLTGCRSIRTLADGVRTANELRKAVFEATGLTMSVGVSDNKTFAKLASDYKKPDAVTRFGPDEYARRVMPLGIGEMLFVGRASAKRLKLFGIETIGDAAALDESFFMRQLGKDGTKLCRAFCGHDDTRVRFSYEPDLVKSIGNSATPPRDICGEEDVRRMLYALSDKVCLRMRRLSVKATTLAVSVRDTALRTEEHQCAITPTDNADVFASHALALYHAHFDADVPARSMGLRVSGLVEGTLPCQPTLFDEDERKTKRRSDLDAALDNLRQRYGSRIVERAQFIGHPLSEAVLTSMPAAFART